MKRSRPLRRKGGRRFPKQHDPAYWLWCGDEIVRGRWCDACGRRMARHRAHVIPRSRGGPDRANIALLCHECHDASEKRAEAFRAETGVDLFDKAAAHDRRYQEEQWLTR